ncbi:hypothetical protein HUK82_15635, partial [Ameyamaea chiangmaiensis]|nr:hypothetical protein [Ameyamaea chiangmaiensis]
RAAPAPTAADADAPLPPPPDGYTPVQDMDEAIIAHSPAVLAHTGPGLPGGEAQQITRQDQNVPSHFSVFGLPIKFNAPVPPPYNAEFTYRTFGGQPGNGRGDATAAWGTAGEP